MFRVLQSSVCITAVMLAGAFTCQAQSQLVVLAAPSQGIYGGGGASADTFTIGSQAANGQAVTGIPIFLSSDSSWLKLNSDCSVNTPGASSISTSTPATVSFCADPTKISAGNGFYVGLIRATASSSSYAPVTVSIKIQRFPPGDFTVDPSILTLSTNLTNARITIHKSNQAGNQAENESAVTITSAQLGQAAPEGNWLQATLRSSIVTTTAPGEVDIVVNRGNLISQAPATYVHTLVVTDSHFNVDAVTVSLTIEPPPEPQIQSGGVASAGAFGQLSGVAPGSWIEIFGSNLANNTRSWAKTDFIGAAAPTSLDGTKVTVAGQSAFVDYISPGQVNAQVPANIPTGSQPVVVTTKDGASSSYLVTVNPVEPGLLAPVSFKLAGKQYVAALFPDGIYVLPPGAISGVSSRRARAGDTITLYGIGFGPVTPNTSPGQVTQLSNKLTAPLHVFVGQTEASLTYAGLAPNAIGLYQFNLVVPAVPSSDLVPLKFTLNGLSGAQTLYIPIQ